MRAARSIVPPSEPSFESPFLPMPLKRHRTLQRLAAARQGHVRAVGLFVSPQSWRAVNPPPTPLLTHPRSYHTMSLERHNMKSKLTLYYNDLFHTMVNVRPLAHC